MLISFGSSRPGNTIESRAYERCRKGGTRRAEKGNQGNVQSHSLLFLQLTSDETVGTKSFGTQEGSARYQHIRRIDEQENERECEKSANTRSDVVGR